MCHVDSLYDGVSQGGKMLQEQTMRNPLTSWHRPIHLPPQVPPLKRAEAGIETVATHTTMCECVSVCVSVCVLPESWCQLW